MTSVLELTCVPANRFASVWGFNKSESSARLNAHICDRSPMVSTPMVSNIDVNETDGWIVSPVNFTVLDCERAAAADCLSRFLAQSIQINGLHSENVDHNQPYPDRS